MGSTELKYILIAGLIILFSGCLQQNASHDIAVDQKMENVPVQTESSVKKTTIEKISDELNMLNANGWNKLVNEIGRPKATTVLWYHVRKKYSVDTKVVFGNPNKLNSCLAILASKGGKSSYPKIKIKGVEYYVIDTQIPAIISNFKYGDMFDDPDKSTDYLSSYFRLKKADLDKVEQWTKETGVAIEYTDYSR